MAFGVPKNSVSLEDIMNRVTEIDILSFYFNIKEIPCVIHSPFREDNFKRTSQRRKKEGLW